MSGFLGPPMPLPVPAAAGGPAAGGASGASLAFSIQTQQQKNWCWAGIGASVAGFYGRQVWRQCDIASAELPGFACCSEPDASDPGRCNVYWYLDRALRRVGHFDRMTWAAASFADIQAGIGSDRPLCCRVAWSGGGAHFMAISGWSIDPAGIRYVDVEDPGSGSQVLKTYADLCHAFNVQGDAWTHSYFTVDQPNTATAGAVAGARAPTNA
jgi:hypothetical protein